jgi:hypothetical protein
VLKPVSSPPFSRGAALRLPRLVRNQSSPCLPRSALARSKAPRARPRPPQRTKHLVSCRHQRQERYRGRTWSSLPAVSVAPLCRLLCLLASLYSRTNANDVLLVRRASLPVEWLWGLCQQGPHDGQQRQTACQSRAYGAHAQRNQRARQTLAGEEEVVCESAK